MYSHIKASIKNFFYTKEKIEKDIIALELLSPLMNNYLPWTSSSIRPSGLVKILNEIIVNNRSNIVECGSGISTVYIGLLLKKLKRGKLLTVEDDQMWIVTLKKMIEQEGLSDVVTIIHAPLVKSDFAIDNNKWYDIHKIEPIIKDTKIDLLLVDGPLAYKKECKLSRYPAAYFFKKFFADNFSIILDDINRSGEKFILKKWQNDLKINFTLNIIEGGIAIGRSNKNFSYNI